MLAWAYACVFVGYLLWTRSSLHRPWWLKALSPLSFWVFLPTLALPPLELLARSPSFLVPALLSATLFTYRYLLPMLPKYICKTSILIRSSFRDRILKAWAS